MYLKHFTISKSNILRYQSLTSIYYKIIKIFSKILYYIDFLKIFFYKNMKNITRSKEFN